MGLETNTKKMQVMVCTPGRIRVQLPTDSYRRMREGVAAGEELTCAVTCHACNKPLQARSLCAHLASVHDIHQQVVVAEGLLEERQGVQCLAELVGGRERIRWLFPGCPGVLSSTYML